MYEQFLYNLLNKLYAIIFLWNNKELSGVSADKLLYYAEFNKAIATFIPSSIFAQGVVRYLLNRRHLKVLFRATSREIAV